MQEPEDAEDVDSEEFEDEEDYDDRPRKRKKKANDRFGSTTTFAHFWLLNKHSLSGIAISSSKKLRLTPT